LFFATGPIGLRGAMRAIATLGCEGAMRAIASSMSPQANPLPLHVLTRAKRMRVYFCPQHWLLCQLGMYKFELKYLLGAKSIGMAPRSITCDAQQTAPRETAWEPLPSTHNKRRRRKRPGQHDQVPATHNERRRGQKPGYNE
jgi:hypothetical protein